MKSVQSHPSAALLGVANKPPLTWELPQPKRIALNVATLLDGKGGTLRDTVVVVSGDKIERIWWAGNGPEIQRSPLSVRSMRRRPEVLIECFCGGVGHQSAPSCLMGGTGPPSHHWTRPSGARSSSRG